MAEFDYTEVIKASHEHCEKKIKEIKKQYSDVEKAFGQYKTNVLFTEIADILTAQCKERGYLTSDDIRIALAMLEP